MARAADHICHENGPWNLSTAKRVATTIPVSMILLTNGSPNDTSIDMNAKASTGYGYETSFSQDFSIFSSSAATSSANGSG